MSRSGDERDHVEEDTAHRGADRDNVERERHAVDRFAQRPGLFVRSPRQRSDPREGSHRGHPGRHHRQCCVERRSVQRPRSSRERGVTEHVVAAPERRYDQGCRRGAEGASVPRGPTHVFCSSLEPRRLACRFEEAPACRDQTSSAPPSTLGIAIPTGRKDRCRVVAVERAELEPSKGDVLRPHRRELLRQRDERVPALDRRGEIRDQSQLAAGSIRRHRYIVAQRHNVVNARRTQSCQRENAAAWRLRRVLAMPRESRRRRNHGLRHRRTLHRDLRHRLREGLPGGLHPRPALGARTRCPHGRRESGARSSSGSRCTSIRTAASRAARASPECPVSAIFDDDDLPSRWAGYREKNAAFFTRGKSRRAADREFACLGRRRPQRKCSPPTTAGVDMILASSSRRDALRCAFSDWLPTGPSGP